MTALVLYYDEFDHGEFLRGAYDEDHSDAVAMSYLVGTTEDEVFALWRDGRIQRSPIPGETPEVDRIYHVDARAGEMWTLNPDTGAALSSETWDFEDSED